MHYMVHHYMVHHYMVRFIGSCLMAWCIPWARALLHLRQAAEDSVAAYEIDPDHLKSWQRAAQAHLALALRLALNL